MLEIKAKNYIFSLRKTAEGKFMHIATKPNSDGVLNKYLVADCIDPDATKAFGIQTRKIVKTFFEGSMVFNQLVEAMQASIINKETGESSKPLAGYFVDIPCGFNYVSEFDGRKVVQSTVSLFIMAGENFEVVKARAIRAVEGMRIKDAADSEIEADIKISQETNAPKPSSTTDF
jgi:hypothetical protein